MLRPTSRFVCVCVLWGGGGFVSLCPCDQVEMPMWGYITSFLLCSVVFFSVHLPHSPTPTSPATPPHLSPSQSTQTSNGYAQQSIGGGGSHSSKQYSNATATGLPDLTRFVPVGTHTCTHAHVHTCMCAYTHTHTHTHIHSYTYSHTHIHTYTHTHIHMHIPTTLALTTDPPHEKQQLWDARPGHHGQSECSHFLQGCNEQEAPGVSRNEDSTCVCVRVGARALSCMLPVCACMQAHKRAGKHETEFAHGGL